MRCARTLGIVGLLASLVGCSTTDGPNADSGPNDGAVAATDADAASDPDAAVPSLLDDLLADLRADAPGTVLDHSREEGWPVAVPGGYLVVSLDKSLDKVAGDHDDWAGSAMTVEDDFAWGVVSGSAGARYKFTDGDRWEADPWSRAYHYDDNGLMSQVAPTAAHLERFFEVGDAQMPPRTVRVWVPAEPATHVLYCHDGQNLFAPSAPWGGWKLQEQARAGLMLVGIDNTSDRTAEYTHVSDDMGSGPVGGKGDAYAEFVNTTVRALIDAHYGEPGKVGSMGSSLGGLISLHLADRHPDQYVFAASLSGTLGWGSKGGKISGKTIIERYQTAGHRSFVIYLDSGGSGPPCVDSDGDGIEDDDGAPKDNYCETKQMESTLIGLGYTSDVDLWHWWEANAEHNEAAWAARVFRPIDHFMAL